MAENLLFRVWVKVIFTDLKIQYNENLLKNTDVIFFNMNDKKNWVLFCNCRDKNKQNK